MIHSHSGPAHEYRDIEILRSIQHVIVDRDGVLNQEPGGGEFVTDPEGFHWLPGALDALAELRALGVRVSVATNQSGIGRGILSEQALEAVHNKMTCEAAGARGSIDAIFYCPHPSSAGCSCRKPAPGLIVAAVAESGISAGNTLVIGDADRDLDAAQSAGVHAVLVRTGKGRLHESYATAIGVPVFDDLTSLVAALAGLSHPPAQNMESLQAIFAEHRAVVADAAAQVLPALARCIGVTRNCLAKGRKIMACGNGGSAADAQHFIAELVGRYDKSRTALAGLVLGTDAATFTAVSNDFGFEQMFSRQVDALAQPGDVLIAISTSGNSRNVINAATAARTRGCIVIALTGRLGGELARHADLVLRIPSDTVARIQEVHELCLHAMAQALDSNDTSSGC